jgi:hypothetical protein
VGFSNVSMCYVNWGGLKDRPLRLLVYMALLARDGDAKPWCGIGHEQLATMALGLRFPADDDELYDEHYDAVLRKVRRHLTTLRRAGAIETDERATYGTHGARPARYRLYLDGPAAATARVVEHTPDELGARRRRRATG